eukprot:732294_1
MSYGGSTQYGQPRQEIQNELLSTKNGGFRPGFEDTAPSLLHRTSLIMSLYIMSKTTCFKKGFGTRYSVRNGLRHYDMMLLVGYHLFYRLDYALQGEKWSIFSH